jgi:23S rRNA (cytosine1962-C5)-methyltransferase
MIKIFLKKGKDEAVRRFHPWVFSGALGVVEGQPADGDWVEVFDYQKKWLAAGHYNTGSIAIRLLTFVQMPIDAKFWTEKLQNALLYRQTLGLWTAASAEKTNCFRLIHAEGDGLPGLIVDIYDSVAVVQCHSVGMHRHINAISTALQTVFENRLEAIYDKSVETLPVPYVAEKGLKNSYIFGTSTVPKTVVENDCRFDIDWETGQKTGFFIDQRDNRDLIRRYCTGKTVLNAFCYSGGFSVYALQAGAKSVDSIDISAKAIELTNRNVALNTPYAGAHTAEVADVMVFLKENKNIYDVMVVDPPAFAKSVAKRHAAVQAYKRLNAMALKQISPGGILFTFSCSQVVDRLLFYNTITAAAIEAGRKVRVMHHLNQPADHPVSMFHIEGAYLKGLVLQVE